MSRINVYEELRTDPRFTALCARVPRHTAYGALICLWELGQTYWKKKEVIPEKLALLLPNIEDLEATGFVSRLDGGFYCAGAKERWGFLTARSEAARAAGVKSGLARRKKTEPVPNIKGLGSNQREPTRTNANQTNGSGSYSVSVSSSLSSSGSDSGSGEEKGELIPSATPSGGAPQNEIQSCTPGEGSPAPSGAAPKKPKPKPEPKVLATRKRAWELYREAYLQRWKKEPVRNATVNTQIASIVARLGEDAPEVLAFYVHHNDGFYVRNCHPVGLCLKNAEGLHTQWANCRQITNTTIRQFEQTQHYREQMARAEQGEL